MIYDFADHFDARRFVDLQFQQGYGAAEQYEIACVEAALADVA